MADRIIEQTAEKYGLLLTAETLEQAIPPEPCECGGNHNQIVSLEPECHPGTGWDVAYADGHLYLSCQSCDRSWWVIPMASKAPQAH